jgi:twitching motility protein PilT
MQTMNDALYQLYVAREVSADECTRASGDPNEFLRMIGKGPTDDNLSSPGNRPADRAAVGGLGRR